jgi:hypothetical protein
LIFLSREPGVHSLIIYGYFVVGMMPDGDVGLWAKDDLFDMSVGFVDPEPGVQWIVPTHCGNAAFLPVDQDQVVNVNMADGHSDHWSVFHDLPFS